MSKEKGERAIFAGGCFWCIEAAFEEYNGVISAVSGYTGGQMPSPSYNDVASGQTDHKEAVEVRYNPEKVTYQELVDHFFSYIDPTDTEGQFADKGRHYQTAIFYLTPQQQEIAEATIKKLEKSGLYDKPIATAIIPATRFYAAESYHQDYFKKNARHYQQYFKGSGREAYIENQKLKKNQQVFQKPDDDTLRKTLTPLQYKVTQEDGTEPPFDNAYWNHKEKGIYVDIVSGEPLFSSEDKYDSGTGWPSFSKPIDGVELIEKEDRKLFTTRIEVRSPIANSHLGHVFPDGPKPTGLRYCINSAALKFIPSQSK